MAKKEVSDALIDALMGIKYGARPFDPKKDKPKDVGLGGPSTEYIAGSEDQFGVPMNYPQIWWTNGQPVLLDPDAARDRALLYEAVTGETFPRYGSFGAADFGAMNRSALGGASKEPLARPWWSTPVMRPKR